MERRYNGDQKEHVAIHYAVARSYVDLKRHILEECEVCNDAAQAIDELLGQVC